MRRVFSAFACALILSSFSSSGAFAQGTTTTSLSGVVTDSDGGPLRCSRAWTSAFKKRFPFAKRANFELEYDVMNVFNAVNFNAVAQASSSTTINQVTSAYTDVDNTFDPGGRLGQLVLRINW